MVNPAVDVGSREPAGVHTQGMQTLQSSEREAAIFDSPEFELQQRDFSLVDAVRLCKADSDESSNYHLVNRYFSVFSVCNIKFYNFSHL